MLNVVADSEYRLPAGDWVCADDRVDGGELFANVIGGAPLGRVHFEAAVFGSLVEFWLRVGGG